MSFGRVFVVSRDPGAFIKTYPHLQNFDFIQGDIRSFKFPILKLHGLIHGATTASAKLNSENPTEMFETIVEGTKKALRCAKNSPGCRLLMISSGAV
ncbi:MAG: NAD(P)-dependent oxidoreductase [Deltaproteobacteria bacterium]|nr:NAD(P)-dependent oxidoreductase [Deltaproteobacteria bacterium]